MRHDDLPGLAGAFGGRVSWQAARFKTFPEGHHPNVLAIFDFGMHGGVSYTVMELLEGETLRGKPDAFG
jgi:hypothetical protein